MDPKTIAEELRKQLTTVEGEILPDMVAVRTRLGDALSLIDGGAVELTHAVSQMRGLADLVELIKPCPEPPPPSGAVIHYRNQWAEGRHAPWVGAFGMGESAPGNQGTITIEPYAPAPSGYCLNVTAFGGPTWQDNRMEQRFNVGALRRAFIGLTLDVPANYKHRDAEGPDNNKQLRFWAGPYERNLTVGFSLLPTSSGISKLIIETIVAGAGGASKYPVLNRGPYTYCMRPGTRQRFGFEVVLASGLGKKDGRIDLWSNGIRTTADTFVTLPDGTKKQTVWESWFRNLDLWSEYNRENPSLPPDQEFNTGFFPGWSNSGFDENTSIRYIDFVIADRPLPEYITP